MLDGSPLQDVAVFHIGPLPVGEAVVTTWGIMAGLTAVAWSATRRLAIDPGPLQAALEIVVETIAQQIEDVLRKDATPFLPLIGTLFLYLVCANLAAMVPGVRPPTGHIETPAALAVIVFLSVHWFGIRTRGVVGYLRRFGRPSLLLLPLNLLAEVTRTFSLMIRLFGNMMSHEFVIAIVLLLAGLLVPIPFMLLGILIGLVQAYIFTVLAIVFIGAGVDSVET